MTDLVEQKFHDLFPACAMIFVGQIHNAEVNESLNKSHQSFRLSEWSVIYQIVIPLLYHKEIISMSHDTPMK